MAIVTLLPAIVGCTTVGGPGASTYFDCSDGSMLKVTKGQRGATMQIDNGPPILMRLVPANSGSAYENDLGFRLAIDRGRAILSGRNRQAPATCSPVAVPR